MNILFLGTDAFAVPSFLALSKKHNIVAVVTRPDKPKGRGLAVQPTAMKVAAEKSGIPVLKPSNLKSESFRNELSKMNFDIAVVVAYGRLLPEDMLEKPEKGCVCLHPSMLPEFRGCSPIESAILAGNENTGISVFFVEKDFDTGGIITQRPVRIDPEDTGGTLRERLSIESVEVLLKAIDDIEKGRVEIVPQQPEIATWAPKLCRENALISWSDPVSKIHNCIRAHNPKPGAFTHFGGKILKIHRSRVISGDSNEPAGSVTEIVKNEGFVVSCGSDRLLILEVQPEGKNPMSACAFAAGRRIAPGDRLE